MTTMNDAGNTTRRAPHAAPADAVVAALSTDAERGLATEEAERRLVRFGANELVAAKATPWWRRLVAQFQDVFVALLLGAAILAGLFGDWTDTAVIGAIVLLNAGLGFAQEERASRAVAALKSLGAPMARIRRDGRSLTVPAKLLTPGDVVEVEAGDHVPADSRLLWSFGVRVNEASLTGESVPVDKSATDVLPEDAPLGNRTNLVFQGTVVTAGKGAAVVVATGMRTELGRIASLMEKSTSEPTPLQRQLARLGRGLLVACLVLVALIFALDVWRRGNWAEAILFAISLVVAAVPEGLPAIVTISLTLGLQRMAKRNALMRKLASVETLGCVSVICSDKTGTLTRNEMTVREVVTARRHFRVDGTGYAPRGGFQSIDDTSPVRPEAEKDLQRLLEVGALCNHAQVTPMSEENWEVTGDPTEGALIVAAMKGGIDPISLRGRLLHEIPFDSERKAMSIVMSRADGKAWMETKGAAEVVIGRCQFELVNGETVPLSDDRRADWRRRDANMAGRALRVLALAFRPVDDPNTESFHEEGLILAGLVGMIDPPRDEVRDAVATCRTAGIRPVMITGDHPETAVAIGRELDILRDGQSTMTGHDLDRVNDETLADQVDNVAVYARVSAEHKLRVIEAWRRRGQVVAMTGDGVNDAPAVKRADIGVAMGRGGTDVTREAAAMVLLDDNFATIVAAVEEGRAIYDNLRKFLVFLLSCNIGEMLLVLAASILGWPSPLSPAQLLWINLVTDGLAALALGMEPPEPGVMRRPPRHPSRRLLSGKLGRSVFLQGTLIAGAGFVAFALVYQSDPNRIVEARTAAFCALVFAELLRAFAARSPNLTFFELGVGSNPYLALAVVGSALLQLAVIFIGPLARLFDIARPDGRTLLIIAAVSFGPVTVIELAKLLARRRRRRRRDDANPDALA